MNYDEKQETQPSRIVTGQLDLSHRGKGSGDAGAAKASPAKRTSRRHSGLPPADYHAAIRLHILRNLATGTYRTHRMAAEVLGVSEVWVGRVVNCPSLKSIESGDRIRD